MSIHVFLNFNGNCRKAAEFYAQVFDAPTPKIASFNDAPPHPDFPMTEDLKKLVMYTEVYVAGSKIMLSDVPPDIPLRQGNNISITLNSEDPAQVEKWFEGLKADGKVEMELQKTMWSELYGMVTDQFGISWQLNYISE